MCHVQKVNWGMCKCLVLYSALLPYVFHCALEQNPAQICVSMFVSHAHKLLGAIPKQANQQYGIVITIQYIFAYRFFFLGGGFQNRQILFYSTAHIHIHTVLFHIVNDKLMRMCSTLGRVYHFAVASLNSTFPVLPKNLAPSMLLYNKSIARDRGSSTQTGGTTRASELDVERDVVCFDWWRRKDSIFASSPVCFDYISSNPLRRNLRRSEVRSVSTGTPRAIRQSCRCCRLRPLRRPACRSSPPWIPPRRGAKSSRTR